jgi:hypothetical protein
MLVTECGCALDHTITSSHARVSGWNRKSRNAPMYGRGCTGRSRVSPGASRAARAAGRCVARMRSEPFRSRMSSLRRSAGSESGGEGVAQAARYSRDGAGGRGGVAERSGERASAAGLGARGEEGRSGSGARTYAPALYDGLGRRGAERYCASSW